MQKGELIENGEAPTTKPNQLNGVLMMLDSLIIEGVEMQAPTFVYLIKLARSVLVEELSALRP